jgi:hypothetical protein
MPELINALQYGLPSALVVLTYLIINRILDSKDKSKKIEISNELVQCFNDLNNYLRHITKDIVETDDDKCLSAIRMSFSSMSWDLSEFANFTITKNNVQENKARIKENISTVVEAAYVKSYNDLSLYTDGKHTIAEFLDPNWKLELKDDLSNIIFDSTKNKEDRIYEATRRVSIRTKQYYNFINNKFIEYAKHNSRLN